MESGYQRGKKRICFKYNGLLRHQDERRYHLDSVFPNIKWDEVIMLNSATDVVIKSLLSVKSIPKELIDKYRTWCSDLEDYCHEDIGKDDLISVIDEILDHA